MGVLWEVTLILWYPPNSYLDGLSLRPNKDAEVNVKHIERNGVIVKETLQLAKAKMCRVWAAKNQFLIPVMD